MTQTIYVSFGGETGTITLTANPASFPADGSSSDTITATLLDHIGSLTASAGTEVIFSTGQRHFGNGGKSYTVATPDSTGVVKVALHGGVVPGTTYVVAKSNEISHIPGDDLHQCVRFTVDTMSRESPVHSSQRH